MDLVKDAQGGVAVARRVFRRKLKMMFLVILSFAALC